MRRPCVIHVEAARQADARLSTGRRQLLPVMPHIDQQPGAPPGSLLCWSLRPAANLREQQCVPLGNTRQKVMGGQLITKVQAVDSAKKASRVQRPFLDLQGWLLRQRFFTSKVLPAMPRRLRWALRRGYFAPVDLIERFRRGHNATWTSLLPGAGVRATDGPEGSPNARGEPPSITDRRLRFGQMRNER